MGAGRSEVITLAKTYTAGAAIVANTFVMLDSSGEVITATDGAEVKGVALCAAASGASVSVALQNSGNIVRVVSGAAVTLGGQVASNATGQAIDAATADFEVGQADEGSAAILEYAIVHLTRGATA